MRSQYDHADATHQTGKPGLGAKIGWARARNNGLFRLHMWIGLIIAALICTLGAARAEILLPFAFDWGLEGQASPFLLAIDRGHYAAEGLRVEMVEGAGSLDAIPKVASGAFPVGFTDINSLMKFLDQNPGAPVTAVMMVYDKPPFAIIGRKSLGIREPADLEGRTLGVPPPDGAWAQFPIFAKEQQLDMTRINVEPVSFSLRGPLLAEGSVAAVTGFSFLTSSLSDARLRVPEEDITVLLMADYGVALYGNAIIVNTDFAYSHPAAITGFIRGTALGWHDAIADPQAAIASLMRRNTTADPMRELRRLNIAITAHVLTDYVREHGMGGVDPARFANSIAQMKSVYHFNTEPEAGVIFNPAFLPTDGSLILH